MGPSTSIACSGRSRPKSRPRPAETDRTTPPSITHGEHGDGQDPAGAAGQTPRASGAARPLVHKRRDPAGAAAAFRVPFCCSDWETLDEKVRRLQSMVTIPCLGALRSSRLRAQVEIQSALRTDTPTYRRNLANSVDVTNGT